MGKTIIITGGSDGIGKAAAKQLATDHDIIIVGRNEQKTKTAAAEMGAKWYLADFSRLDEVRALAEELSALDHIDVLANNAGGIQDERKITADGFETTLQTNHLAPFLLTQLLLPKLIEAKAAIINTASAANARGRINLNDLNLEHGYGNFKAYADSKLMNILFTKELDHRYHREGLRSVAFHPGVIASNFGSGGGFFVRTAYHTPLKRVFNFKSVADGAAPLVHFASTPAGDPHWHAGNYYNPDLRAGRTAYQAHDLGLAHNLWERSLDMVGLPHA